MFLVVLALLSLPSNCSASHSLSLLATYILGDTQFPEFTITLRVNNIPVEYYDSNINQIVSRRFWRTDDVIEEKELQTYVIQDVFKYFKVMSPVIRKHFNNTGDVHVLQELAACDVDVNNVSRFAVLYAYDGQETFHYDTVTQKQYSEVPELNLNTVKLGVVNLVYKNVHLPLCERTLHRFLKQDKNFLMRKVHPRVRVFQKTQADSGETQVICLAIGFYPRHINLSLLRDERPVPEEHLTGGELLPNGDGTYQMRKSLRVSEEELQGKHRYTCTVTHLSPNNTLHVSWESESTPDVVIISVAVVSVLTVTSLIITAAVLYRRKRKTGAQKGCLPATKGQYTAAQTG